MPSELTITNSDALESAGRALNLKQGAAFPAGVNKDSRDEQQQQLRALDASASEQMSCFFARRVATAIGKG